MSDSSGVVCHSFSGFSRFDVDAFVRDRMELLTRRGDLTAGQAKAVVDSDVQMLRRDPKRFKRKFFATGLGRR